MELDGYPPRVLFTCVRNFFENLGPPDELPRCPCAAPVPLILGGFLFCLAPIKARDGIVDLSNDRHHENYGEDRRDD